MRPSLTLTVTTPLAVTMSATGVASVRAEDRSGSFGLLPGHADLLTVLGASVLRWRGADGVWTYCAVHGGILRMSGGGTVDVACREAIVGDDLETLEALVDRTIADHLDATRQARAEQTRLNTHAIRGLMRHLGTAPAGDALAEAFR